METGKIHTLSRASRSTWIVLMMGVGFCAGGISLAREGNLTVGIGLAVAFGFMAVVAFVTVLPGSSSLSYDDVGFWTTRMFRRGDRIPWTAVSKFHVGEVEGKARVVYEFSDTRTRESLPDNYGQDAATLARELNARRDHAIGAEP